MEDYWRILNQKIYCVLKEGRHKQAWQGQNEENYEEELSILRPHFKSVVWGFGSAVAVFLSFRLSGSKRFMNFVKSGSNLKRLREAPPVVDKLGYNTTREKKMKELRSGLSIPIDFFLSTLIGGSVTLFLSDFDKVKADTEKVPLVEGRSFVADELCLDFIAQYHKISERPKGNDQVLDPSLIHFISNCQKRNLVEKHIKKQVHHFEGEAASVPIPSPGVQYHLDRINQQTMNDS